MLALPHVETFTFLPRSDVLDPAIRLAHRRSARTSSVQASQLVQPLSAVLIMTLERKKFERNGDEPIVWLDLARLSGVKTWTFRREEVPTCSHFLRSDGEVGPTWDMRSGSLAVQWLLIADFVVCYSPFRGKSHAWDKMLKGSLQGCQPRKFQSWRFGKKIREIQGASWRFWRNDVLPPITRHLRYLHPVFVF